jgi:hypothetical protein
MNGGKISQQLHTILGAFMVLFYLGVGIFIMFFADRWYNIDKAIRVIMGSTFLFYGTFRTFVSYKQIVEAFFTRENDEE